MRFMDNRNFLSLFNVKKPVIGVIHMKGDTDDSAVDLAKREIDIYAANGVNAVLVETYFGGYNRVERILGWLKDSNFPMPYGVNCLNVDAMGFELADEFGCGFMQLDSVVGHVKPRDEETLDAFFRLYRKRSSALVMGGVRFKYQPVLSERTLQEDLVTAMGRCDAVCVTQDATGQETSMDKIRQFRDGIGDFPLIICAGVNAGNAEEQLAVADGAVVGSFFKDNYKDTGDVCPQHVRELMAVVERLRQQL